MATESDILADFTLIGDSETTLFTATGSTVLDSVIAVNTSDTETATVSIHIAAGGASATDSNAAILSKALDPQQTYTCPELSGQSMRTGYVMSAQSGSAGIVSVRASGRITT